MPSASGEAYSDPRAHTLRAEYLTSFGGDEIPGPVHAIGEDLFGLCVQEEDLRECPGRLIPAARLVLLNAAERAADDGTPIRRQRFTLAHEIGHWVCHCGDCAKSIQRSGRLQLGSVSPRSPRFGACTALASSALRHRARQGA